MENGSAATRVGYSGDTQPKYIIPTLYGKSGETKYFGDAIDEPRSNMDVFSPMSDGCVQDWNAMADIWKYVYQDKILFDPSEAPLAITEQAWNPATNRQRALEVAFEDLKVPAFSIVKSPICAAYESGRPTALVIDIGSSVASVTPVVDGNIFTKAAFHSRFAGDFVNLHILTHLESRGINITPQYLVKKKSLLDPGQPARPELYSYSDIAPSFHAYQVAKVLHNFKETTSQVSDVPFTHASPFARIGRQFEFPDGFNLAFGPERFTTTEPLFKPSQFTVPGIPLPEGGVYGLGDLLYLSLSKLDVPPEVLMNLLGNIIVTGGSSLLQGMPNRIEQDILHMFPNYSPRFYLPVNAHERKCLNWSGASILASLGSFDNMWVTKREYEELGPEVAEKRFKM